MLKSENVITFVYTYSEKNKNNYKNNRNDYVKSYLEFIFINNSYKWFANY